MDFKAITEFFERLGPAVGRWGRPLRWLGAFVLVVVVSTYAWKTFWPEDKGTTLKIDTVVGQQIGDNNKQEITIKAAEEKSVYTSASVLSQERDGDQWVTKILFNRSPGKWDAAETSRFSLALDGPYDETRVDDAEGFLSPRGGMILEGIGRRRPGEGIWEQEIITPPRNGQKVVIRFRGPRPLGIIRADFSPQ
jgi:hypothetical protein